MAYPPSRVKYGQGRGCCSLITHPLAQLSRKPYFRVFLLVVVLVAIYSLYQAYERWLDLWHPKGLIEYHMRMTPQFYNQDFTEKHLTDNAMSDLGYNAVIFYLVNKYRLRELLLSLKYLTDNVSMHPWPILLMYSDDMDDHRLRREFELRAYDMLGPGEASRELIRRIEWIRLDWELPDGISKDKNVVQPTFEDYWPGYHLMCAFYASTIFDHPRLANVTYYLRLDTDSYIFRPLCYDPIARFHAHNRTYAYRSATRDPAWVTHGMWAFVDEYSKANPDVDAMMRKNGWWWPEGSNREHDKMVAEEFPTYYNNFEIVKLEAFRTPEIKRWLDELMSDPERVFKYRWGDAPIRYTTVNMFFDIEKDVEEYCAIRYWHNGVQGRQCDCVP